MRSMVIHLKKQNTIGFTLLIWGSLWEKNSSRLNERNLQHFCLQPLYPCLVLIKHFGAAVERQFGIAHHISSSISLTATYREALILRWALLRDDKTFVLTEAKQTFNCATVAKQDNWISTCLFNSKPDSRIGWVICWRQPADSWLCQSKFCNTIEGIFSSVFSISHLRVFTYQRAHTPINTRAPMHRELRSVRGREEMKAEKGWGRKKASLEGFDMYSKHTWLLHWRMLHFLNTSVYGMGGGRLMSIGE